MREVLATLASLLCSQVSNTLYSVSPSDLSGPASTAGSENITAVQGESVSFRLTELSLVKPSLAARWAGVQVQHRDGARTADCVAEGD